ncbi:hypothetical protein PR048_020100 [Dryococelus australis]|uniref:Uncharacterized protein n=1 Tax=Dryococelus australis TaxID=614101 RepID=A0ABQ9H5H1_9NEOP|nr:hypothetical protein PR048_020100 [Dryococelus australis]
MAPSKHEAKIKHGSLVVFQAFTEYWEEQFFITIGKSSNPICLICNLIVAVLNKYNIAKGISNRITLHLSPHPCSVLRIEYTEEKGSVVASKTCLTSNVFNCLFQLCTYYSLTTDENCDVADNAQFLVFVKCINNNFEVFEEILGLCQLSVNTAGKDIFEALKNCIEKCDAGGVKLA